MEDYIEINKVGLTKLDNGRHYEYHNFVYGLLSAADATKIGVPAASPTNSTNSSTPFSTLFRCLSSYE